MLSVTGELRCKTTEEAARVRRFLPEHIRLSRAEPGCLHFSVTPKPGDPLTWLLEESFLDEAAFAAHQARMAASPWGHETAGITRDFNLETRP